LDQAWPGALQAVTRAFITTTIDGRENRHAGAE
jgi:hypothetical protein